MGARGEDLEEVLPLLCGFLKDEDPWLRGQAANALRFMRGRAAPAMPALLKALDTRDVPDPALAKSIRLGIIAALEGIGPGAKDAVPVLIEIAECPKNEPDERRRAVSALGHIGSAAKRAIPLLTKITVEKNDPGLRQTALWALQQLKQ
jgi:HEAT repeat protein